MVEPKITFKNINLVIPIPIKTSALRLFIDHGPNTESWTFKELGSEPPDKILEFLKVTFGSAI